MAAKDSKKSTKKTAPVDDSELGPDGPRPGVMGQARQVAGFIRSEQGRKAFALLLVLFSIFLLAAFISHFFTGRQDQSLVASGGPLGDPARQKPANWLGSTGAWFADIFIHQGFGIMALLTPIFLGLLGAAILENNYYRFLWRLFRYTLFLTLWGSCCFSFVGTLVTGHATEVGGGFGWYVNDILFNLIGKFGVGLLITLSICIYLVVNWNTEFPLSRWFMHLLPHALRPQIPVAEPETAAETLTQPETQSGTGTENAESHGSETLDTPPMEQEEPEEDPGAFILDVRKAEPETQHIESPLAQTGQTAEPTLTILPADQDPLLESTKREPETPIDLPFELNDTRGKGEPEFVIENAMSNPLLTVEEGQRMGITPPLEGDNIVQVEENKFEKIVQDADQEKLDDEDFVGDWDLYDPTLELSDYKYPPLDLLRVFEAGNREVDRTELEENKNKIVRTLKNYSIDIVSIKATIGPTVTLYEIVPAPGVRIAKIRNLEDDIALSLSALGIRIIAPIPGKGTIGIEIPNSKPEIVSMRSALATEKFRDTQADLPIALGKTISNEVYIADLSKMPHLLIAGATGQGKSVGINGLISSILFKKHPAHVKFVLIDPKKVELSLYSHLEKHFLAKLARMDEPIITDTRQVIHVLNSLCIEMDERYSLLKAAGCRNIKEYNDKFAQRRLNPRKGHKFLPYIVLIIDEFADLMMTAGKEIETPIARLAQLARAIGIHLVLATQRPSVNVITGIIKANFPARISYRVTSKVDSRTILDAGGADQLIGRGDLLFSSGNDMIRIQNPFIDTPEVEKLVEFIESQRGFVEPYYLPEVPEEGDDEDDDDLDDGERDAMFAEAARLIVRHQQGSTSLIQRKLKLGYNRAGRIIDQLERAGIVGSFSGSKAREVLIQDEAHLEQILNSMG